ncbi:phytanoyl-CoA dioxygenase family protein [Zavarzinia compransoris]|uniref:phytanoyl-CoA dioxygenase family protein n=1 Tax=Zavarzinia marina TaxID=2911065 RepID=UPI001F2472BD|nr:phytanoyl-CoA dioxygenase family protein [Zavarzinia marina]MCF4166755.1 phytanoyl-CoA dioxygenase family protein [Zavarzinia marina]
MKAVHLPSTATPEEITAALREHGYCIVDNLVPESLMDRIDAEMGPHVDASLYGDDGFVGKLTKRTGAMIARSPAARELIMNETAIGTAGKFLEKATTFQLHLTQIISVFPGSKAQPIHRDQVAWDFFPFPKDYEVQCNLLWAMTDYTEEMGATRVVPGSHLLDDREYTIEESIPAEMTRGSALFYTGKVYHGAGENKSDKLRQAINITYAVGWVRQEENQYLTTPLEIARTLPEDLLKVMGYQLGCFAMGYVGDFEDPMTVLHPPAERRVLNTDIIKKKADEAMDARKMFNDSTAA